MKRVTAALVLASAFVVVVPIVAKADVGDATSTAASCMGIEAAALSPPGSSAEAPGGARDIKALVDELAPGVPPGLAFYSVAGQLRVGSHEACDEAFGE